MGYLKENIEWDSGGTEGKVRIKCPRCTKWLKTNSKKLTFGNLVAHLNSRTKCQPGVEVQREEAAQARHALDVLFPVATGVTVTVPSLSREDAPFRAGIGGGEVLVVDVLTPMDFAHSLDSVSHLGLDLTDSDSEFSEPIPQKLTLVLPTHHRCVGVLLNWPLDEFYKTYPFHRHGSSPGTLGYEFSGVDKMGTQFRVRSKDCIGVIPGGSSGGMCVECERIESVVERLASMARFAAPHTNHKYLTHEQLCNLLVERDTTIRNWKLKALSLGRRCASMMRSLEDGRRLLMLLASGDVMRLRQLMAQALKEGASVSRIVAKVEDALTGLHHAKGFDSKDLDIAMLVYRLGGRKLLYALNKHIGITAIRTICRSTKFTKITPSSGTPTIHEVLSNIKQTILNDQLTTPPPALTGIISSMSKSYRSGMSVFWDEVSQEEVACYISDTDSVGGLCREHSRCVDTQLRSFDSAEALSRALADGVVHFGKEASVIAMGSFGTELRGAFPVLVSPTCKSETPEESADVLRLVLQAWEQEGAATFGPVWSFASDGDAGRRAMVYKLFLANEIDSRHYLYRYLSRLPGLNLWVGAGDVTGTFDWKHEIKRLARIFRSEEGMVINNTVLNCHMLRQWFTLHLAFSDDMIKRLLEPSDPQDVPRAIELLRAISLIANFSSCSLSPSEMQEASVIRIAATLLLCFVDPFTQPMLSLKEQVTQLSEFAHLAFILFRKHGTSFLSNQLYGDIQTTVKDVIISIAKQQHLDGTQPFYLFWTGDDRLEVLFGRVRMIGGHDTNFNFKQLVDRLGSAADIDAVLRRHPDLDKGHRRLKVTRGEQADHLNPESWIGNVIANDVHLESAWLEGRARATDLLRSISLSVDFSMLFDSGRTTDMLRPFGDGKYPGVAAPDNLVNPEPPIRPQSQPIYPVEVSVAPSLAKPSSSSDSDHSETAAGGTFDIQDCGPSVVVYELPDDSPTSLSMIPITLTPHVGASDSSHSQSHSLEFEDALDEPDSHCDSADGADRSGVSAWVEHEGQRVHKASLCRLVVTPHYSRKSHERKFRVRGFSSDAKPRDFNTDEIIGSNVFVVGDLFSTLISVEDTSYLAVLKCVGIEQKGMRVDSVSSSSLPHPAASIRLLGQILDLRLVPTASLAPAARLVESETETTSLMQCSWIWSGNFVRFDIADKKSHSSINAITTVPMATTDADTLKVSKKSLVIKIISHLCEPINARITSFRPAPDEPEGLATIGSNNSGLTWEFTESEFAILIESLAALVMKHDAVLSLPRLKNHGQFPYRDQKGHPSLVSVDITHALQASSHPVNQYFRCYQCHTEMDAKKARTHVGKHILFAMRGIEEDLRGMAVGALLPCGFCGRSGLERCKDVFLTKKANPQAQTNCCHAHQFNYAPSLKPSTSTPCTNVPILCLIPGCTAEVSGKFRTAVWRYNMPEHIRLMHPGWSSDGIEDGAPIPPAMAQAMLITREEEELMGVPTDKIPPKVQSPVQNEANTRATASRSKKRRVAAASPLPASKRSKQ